MSKKSGELQPEAFLHPPQQNLLDTSLRQLSTQPGRQILAATHSPLFVSYNSDDIADLVRLSKVEAKTDVGQIRENRLKEIFEDNVAINNIFTGTTKAIGTAGSDKEFETELEGVRHFLWLNPERCGLFFAEHVLIVEGLSEQVLTNYLVKTGAISVNARGSFVLETAGKYNIHRFMNLLGEMKINHSILYDLDDTKTGEDKVIQDRLNELIQTSKNSYTVGIESLPSNLETFLGITVPKNDRWKASRILLAVKKGEVHSEKLEAFRKKLNKLLASPAV